MPDIISLGADYSRLGVGFDCAVTRGLKYCGFFGTSAALSKRNYAPDGVDGVIVGTPVYHDGYIELDGGQVYIATDVADHEKVSSFIVGKALSETQSGVNTCYYLSNGSSPTVRDANVLGTGVALFAGSDLRYYNSRWDGTTASNAQIIVSGAPLNAWALMEARCSNSYRLLRNDTSATQSSTAPTANRDLVTGKFRIGSSLTVDTGVVHIAAALLYTGVDLTEDEIAAIKAQLRQVMALPYRAIEV